MRSSRLDLLVRLMIHPPSTRSTVLFLKFFSDTFAYAITAGDGPKTV